MEPYLPRSLSFTIKKARAVPGLCSANSFRFVGELESDLERLPGLGQIEKTLWAVTHVETRRLFRVVVQKHPYGACRDSIDLLFRWPLSIPDHERPKQQSFEQRL